MAYRGYTPAQAAAYKRYSDKQATIYIRVPREERDDIQSHAQAKCESVNAFVRRAIRETMERDKEGKQ